LSSARPIALVAVAPSALSAPILFAIAGGGRSLEDVAGRTLLQRISPNEVSFTVFGVLEGLMMVALAVGSVGAAVLIERFGVPSALIAIGAFLPLVMLFLVASSPCGRPPRRATEHGDARPRLGRSLSSRPSRRRRWKA
jgi:MFS family permease